MPAPESSHQCFNVFSGAMGGGSSIGFESHQPQPGPSHLNPNPYANPSEQNHLQPSPASGAHAPPTTPADPGAREIPSATQQVPAGTRYTPPSTAGKYVIFWTIC